MGTGQKPTLRVIGNTLSEPRRGPLQARFGMLGYMGSTLVANSPRNGLK